MTLTRSAYQAHVEAVRAELEADAITLVEDALLTSGRLHAAALDAGTSTDGSISGVPEDDDAALMWSALLDVWEAAYVRFASDTYRLTVEGKRAPDWLDRASAWIRRFGALMVRRITETTREQIRQVVAGGLEEGLGTREIARRLREVWPDVARVRADAISRTETLRGSSAGSFEGARAVTEETGLVMEKVWLAAPNDGRRRPSHGAADGQVRGMDEPFNVGGYAAMYPHDPDLPPAESVNCRCTFYLQPRQTGKSVDTSHMTDADLARIEQSERNARIRRDYRKARDAGADRLPVLLDIAEREGLSTDSVESIVYRR